MMNIIFDNITPVRRAKLHGPMTSHKAAERAEKFAASHAGQILAALKAHGDLTANEIHHYTGLSVEQCCRRLPEIAGVSVVYQDGQELEREGFRVWRLQA